MRMIKFTFFLIVLFIILNAVTFPGALFTKPYSAAFAQPQTMAVEGGKTVQAALPEKEQDSSAALYRVAGVVMIVWIGLAVFLFRLDRKLIRLQNDVQSLKQQIKHTDK